MRESPIKRLVYATFFSLLAGVLVAAYNPVEHVKADLRADTSGVRTSLHLAVHDLLRG
ncbi:hypothetical protein SAMN03159338_1765 [Sphingomonas sp. NFR04]|uniref:hypothetical protein n=1 Tax=Sphingomonas sp. NFR04 TaxID=1566283 RepID=UPI0008DFAC1E|nr:hypothetical protein [Sphingomonas sp. NFR04]SFJ55794.1 hypothetical protein SAMN03159338_1765 [Sphingomonas sp. NFR04]